MRDQFTNIDETPWEERTTPRGELWWSKDLSGENLGVRIEQIRPGDSSSVHHYHTLEEEHVIVLAGSATLVLGTEERTVKKGDHFWFAAGKEEAHHLENRTDENFEILVFGERKAGDVVVYPNHAVMLVKALGFRQVTYEERKK